jgi:serine/threonine-protein kinase
MVREQLATSLAGRYTLERELGRGGMATVFLARDLKHQRDVALKVLDPELGAVLGAERFLSEIRVTANLQHPNLLPLFDSGEADGLLYYVMPYVEGESLRARLEREKQLRVDEAVRIAVAVANALGYAHQHGVIHRDLKPENILLQAGQPVVADFGIALAVSNAGGQRVTQTGLSLGTPQYMSPEQATGDRAIDGRTDIYSLGAVLYEMLTGEPPHVGTTAQAIIARLMTEKPRPVRATRETVPEHVELAVEIALAKLPADRFTTAFEFANALVGQPVTSHQVVSSARPSTVSSRTWRQVVPRVLPWLIAAAAIIAAITARTGTERRANVGTFALNLPAGVRFTPEVTGARLALSHDGSQIAYVGATNGGMSIYVRPLGDTASRRLPGGDNSVVFGFSPDGRWLLVSDGKLKRLPLDGGTPIVITDSAAAVGDWGDGDQILFVRGGSLFKVAANGGVPQALAIPDSSRGQVRFRTPSFLPGGDAALITIVKIGARSNDYLGLIDMKTGKITDLGVAGDSPRYVAPGYVIFGRGGAALAAPFSVRRRQFTGPATQLLDGVSNYFGAVELYAGDDGTLVFIGGALGEKLQMVVVDRQGRERLIGDERFFSWPRVSPDGKRVAVEIGTGDGSFDVWLYDVASKGFSRLTNNFTGIRPLGWSADGRTVAYLSVAGTSTGNLGRMHVARVPWDLSAPPEVLTRTTMENPEDGSLGPPHTSLVVRRRGYGGPGDLEIAPLDTPNAFKPLVATSADEQTPRISPDGKLLAYVSDETGQYEVYLRPLTGGSGRIQVSAAGGSEPVWSRDGRGFYYRTPGRLMFATIATTPELGVVKRDSIFADPYRREGRAVQYDAFPNGDLLMLKRNERSEPRPTVVMNWRALLRQKGK